MTLHKFFKLLPGLLVSGLAIAWIAYAEDWGTIGSQLLNVTFWPLLPATLLTALHFWLRAKRWRHLLPDEGTESTKLLFDGIVLSNFASFILPLRAGEFVRAFFLTRVSSHGLLVSFSSIVTERLFDLTAVLITFSLVLQYSVALPDWAYHGSHVLSILAGIIVSCIILGIYCRSFLEQSRDFCFQILPERLSQPLIDFSNQLLDAVQILRSKRRMALIIWYTLLTWLSNYLIFYVLLYCVDVTVSPLLAVTTAVIIALAVAAPSAPGFIGVFEAAGRAGFIAVAAPGDTGVTYALLLHLFQYVLFIGYGTYVLTSYDLKLQDLIAGKKIVKDIATP